MPKSFEKCQMEKKFCEDWDIEQHLYCIEPVTASLLFWFGIFVVPTILLNICIRIFAFGHGSLQIICQYPQLFFQGLYGNFLFGPTEFGLIGPRCNKLHISRSLSLLNALLTCIQFAVGVIVLSQNYHWNFIFRKGRFTIFCFFNCFVMRLIYLS